MSELNIRVTHRTEIDGRAVERTIDIETNPPREPSTLLATLRDTSGPRIEVPLPEFSQKERTAGGGASAADVLTESALAAGIRFTRVLADGQYLKPDSDRTDHHAVIDHSTGLMWSVESLGDPSDENDGITQEHCIERCKQLRLLGYDDWRLPTRTELAALVDDTRHEPAIDTSLFPHVKPRWHWTSTPAAWSSSAAWGVFFDDGGVSYGRRSLSGFALAVRRASQ
jgi:hypothetical protein